jgi:hypothetical protein
MWGANSASEAANLIRMSSDKLENILVNLTTKINSITGGGPLTASDLTNIRQGATSVVGALNNPLTQSILGSYGMTGIAEAINPMFAFPFMAPKTIQQSGGYGRLLTADTYRTYENAVLDTIGSGFDPVKAQGFSASSFMNLQRMLGTNGLLFTPQGKSFDVGLDEQTRTQMAAYKDVFGAGASLFGMSVDSPELMGKLQNITGGGLGRLTPTAIKSQLAKVNELSQSFGIAVDYVENFIATVSSIAEKNGVSGSAVAMAVPDMLASASAGTNRLNSVAGTILGGSFSLSSIQNSNAAATVMAGASSRVKYVAALNIASSSFDGTLTGTSGQVVAAAQKMASGATLSDAELRLLNTGNINRAAMEMGINPSDFNLLLNDSEATRAFLDKHPGLITSVKESQINDLNARLFTGPGLNGVREKFDAVDAETKRQAIGYIRVAGMTGKRTTEMQRDLSGMGINLSESQIVALQSRQRMVARGGLKDVFNSYIAGSDITDFLSGSQIFQYMGESFGNVGASQSIANLLGSKDANELRRNLGLVSRSDLLGLFGGEGDSTHTGDWRVDMFGRANDLSKLNRSSEFLGKLIKDPKQIKRFESMVAAMLGDPTKGVEFAKEFESSVASGNIEGMQATLRKYSSHLRDKETLAHEEADKKAKEAKEIEDKKKAEEKERVKENNEDLAKSIAVAVKDMLQETTLSIEDSAGNRFGGRARA